jgi:hypothetical protein
MPIVAAIHYDVEKQNATVNEVASVYGKNSLALLIENTLALRRAVYANKRTAAWLSSSWLQLPALTAALLQGKYNASDRPWQLLPAEKPSAKEPPRAFFVNPNAPCETSEVTQRSIAEPPANHSSRSR